MGKDDSVLTKPTEASSANVSGRTSPSNDIEKQSSLEQGTSAPLQRRLQSRHLQMIAIGGTIGTGLFIGSGSALSSGGPAGIMIDFGIIGVMLFCVIHALGELAVLFPISGITSQGNR